MTASAIAKQLKVNQIWVDYSLSESLQKWMFEENPLSKLEFFTMERSEWQKKYGIPENIQFEVLNVESVLKPEYPEE